MVKPLNMLRADPPEGKLRLERWYYFWINNVYTDPMVLLKNKNRSWTVHPGQNRWIAASLRPPQDRDVILVTDFPLKSWPEEIHSVKIANVSDLKPFVRPAPNSEDWLGTRPVTTWQQWYDGYQDLARRIRQRGQGCLALIDGSRTYTMGEGKIIGCWAVGETGLHAMVSMFTFADSLGWNQP
jgi:hypothetical protein